MDPPARSIAQAEAAWGVPLEIDLEQRLLPWELDLIERVCGDHRHHDVTIFARRGDSLVLVRKPSDPEGVWWAPAGGVGPGESLGDAARREVHEEAGIRCRIDRYVVRMNAIFVSGERRRPWTSHIFAATWESGEPAPVDTGEVEAARWVPIADFVQRVAPLLRASGQGRFEYRLRMASCVFSELGLSGGINPLPPLQCSGC